MKQPHHKSALAQPQQLRTVATGEQPSFAHIHNGTHMKIVLLQARKL